jgi:hypothetical protein
MSSSNAKLGKMNFAPGIRRESTQYAEEGSWYDADRVRFRAGRPENLRGYETKVSATFDGAARDLLTYTDYDQQKRAIFGTPQKLYEHDQDRIVDITPVSTSVTITSAFTVALSATTVTVTAAGHGRATGDYVFFTSVSGPSGGVTIGGNIILGTSVFQVSVIGANSFAIDVATTASAAQSQASQATAHYLIFTGVSNAAPGLGFGAAKYTATEPTSVGISKISTTGSSALVTVSCDAAHNAAANDFVFFKPTSINASPVTVGGNLVLSKPFVTNGSGTTVSVGGPLFTVTSVASTQIIITVDTNASATENATSNLNMTARIFPQSTTGRAYNEPTSVGATGFSSQITQWSLDNWGEDILCNRRKGTLYLFDTDASTTPLRAAKVSGTTNSTPTTISSMLVSPNDRHVIALGVNQFGTTASPSGTYDPMTVRWANQEDQTNWVPSVSSTSGEVQITDGNKIVGGVRSRNAVNIWTDNALWLQTFVGPPFTFKFTQMGSNCGLIAPHAAVDYDGRTAWMGFDNFYVFDGQVRTLDCTVRKYIFDRLNESQKDKIFAGINSEFKEIVWLYPSTDSNECDSYVIWSPDENYWTYGSGIFTTFVDKGTFDNTITTGVSVAGNNLYNNEPEDIFTVNGEAATSFLESADFDIDEGNELMFIDRIIPDLTMNDGTIKFSIKTKNFPDQPDSDLVEKGPFSIAKNTSKVDLRARGRQGRVRVSCESGGTKWQWGSIRMSMQPDGMR